MTLDIDEIKYIKKYKNKKIIILLIQILLIVMFFGLWQITSDLKIINSFIFSSPLKIINTIYNLYLTNNLFINIFTTLSEILIAFILGFIISFILAILLYVSDTFYKIVDPFLNILNSLPKVSLGPILIIWFGANKVSIIVIALLINILVCTETLYIGFKNCNTYFLKLFASYKASKINTLLYLIIPSSFKSIISALKLNISLTLIGCITAEFLVSKAGIGYLIIYGTQVFNLDLVYSGIIILIVLSYLIYKPIKILENKIKKD